MARFDAYIICTSPRSGSTLLCNMLLQSGVAGNPASWFHRPSVATWLETFKLSPQGSTSAKAVLQMIVKAAVAEGSLETGMFGLRLQRHSFDFFTQQLSVLYPDSSSDTERIHQAFGRTAYIHLTRRNKIEQAVSYVKAEQSGLWHVASDGSELERLSPPQPSTYDPERISACFEEVTMFDEQWTAWFASEKITPLTVSYEALAAQPGKVSGEILAYLGCDREAGSDTIPGVIKMADETSQDWVERFSSTVN